MSHTPQPVVPPDQNDPVSPQERAAAEAAVGPVARWAIHRRLYDWVLSFAHKKHATWALAFLSFIESSVFPVPPDVLLAPLCLGNRKKAWWYATVTTVASVLGALLGYAIGALAWEAVDQWMFNYVPGFSEHHFETVHRWYDDYGLIVLFAAAFTPIPFKVFTIAGGVFDQPLIPFILISFVGRAARFFLVAGTFWLVGPKAMPLIDRYFNLLCILFVILLIGGFLVIRLFA